MTEPVKPARRRKPLRRTAWTMLVGGLLTLGLMIGVGLLLFFPRFAMLWALLSPHGSRTTRRLLHRRLFGHDP